MLSPLSIERCFLPLYGFGTDLCAPLERDAERLPLPDTAARVLCESLGPAGYTTLVLADGLCHEIVHVTAGTDGGVYALRGMDQTDRYRWPCGTGVAFDWTPTAMFHLKVDNQPDDPVECPEERWTGWLKSGNVDVYFKDGVAVRERLAKDRTIHDGCYEEPVLTFEQGCLVAVGEGAKPARYVAVCDRDCCE